MTPLKPATFRISEEILEGLQEIKERTGKSVSEQVSEALEIWLDLVGPAPWASRRERAMSREVVEQLSGVGEVTRESGGTSLGPRRYRLVVWQEIHNVRTMGDAVSRVEGLRSITGSVELQGHEGLTELVGESLVLQLQDGRRLPFFFRSSDGSIAPRGSLV
jgi:Ribbon-helix-helix protein, copG family